MIRLRKLGETAGSITLGWDPVAGADGYRFYSAGVLRSRTCDPSRTRVKFAKGQEPYVVEATRMDGFDSGAWPGTDVQQLGRNVMFTAWNPAAALRCPAHWKVAVSADPAFDTAVRAAAPRIKEHGNLLAVWGVQTQIGVQRIRQLAADLKADFVIFQAETPDEYDTAMAADAQLVVGNPNAWTQAQRDDAIARGNSLATLFEVYSNMGAPWPDTASSQGAPVSCEVLGVGWGTSPYQLADYRPHTPDGVWATISVYLAENMDEKSWGLLP